MKEQTKTPKEVVVKTMTVNNKTEDVRRFFENMKYMEIGGEIKKSSLMRQDDGWWTFDHLVAGRSRMKQKSVPEFGILDHIFVGEGLEWQVFVRIIPNEDGSTVTWTFLRPDGLDKEQFEKQLENFDSEIGNWREALRKAH